MDRYKFQSGSETILALKGENKKAFFKEEKIRLSRNYNMDTKDKTLVG